MSQLEKRGKWVFGWVIVRTGKEIRVPPEAYREYGFRVGDEIAFTLGSRSSGGFGIGRADKISSLFIILPTGQYKCAKLSLSERLICRMSKHFSFVYNS
jgi:hypothetical protein